jgi:hypothetical protein
VLRRCRNNVSVEYLRVSTIFFQSFLFGILFRVFPRPRTQRNNRRTWDTVQFRPSIRSQVTIFFFLMCAKIALIQNKIYRPSRSKIDEYLVEIVQYKIVAGLAAVLMCLPLYVGKVRHRPLAALSESYSSTRFFSAPNADTKDWRFKM